MRTVDQDFVADVRRRLGMQACAGPLFEIAHVARSAGKGLVDFTDRGAALFREVHAKAYGNDWCFDFFLKEGARPRWDLGIWYLADTSRQEVAYCTTEQGARRLSDQLARAEQVTWLEGPQMTGPWCVYWWKTYPVGYRLNYLLKGTKALILDV